MLRTVSVAAGVFIAVSGCSAGSEPPAPDLSTPPPSVTVMATDPASMKQFLEGFLASWHSGDEDAVRNAARAEAALNLLDLPPEGREYRLNWDDGCVIGPLGVGRCQFMVWKSGQHALVYGLEYGATVDGPMITDITFQGDTG